MDFSDMILLIRLKRINVPKLLISLQIDLIHEDTKSKILPLLNLELFILK
jgi:hypothetical protein